MVMVEKTQLMHSLMTVRRLQIAMVMDGAITKMDRIQTLAHMTLELSTVQNQMEQQVLDVQ